MNVEGVLSNTGEIVVPAENERLTSKIMAMFDTLEKDMEIGDYEHADVVLARLSKYFHLFGDEHTDYYQYAQDICDEMLNGPVDDEDYYEEDNYLDDWDENALTSAGFGVDESY